MSLSYRDRARVYWWVGRVYCVAIPSIFAKTIPYALDGTGAAMAERATTPFMLAAMLGLAFGVGAQGALLGVTKDAAINSLILMVVMAIIKMQAAYTPAYMMVHIVTLVGVMFGYACVSNYADLRETERESAEAIVIGAAAVNQPYVVTDNSLTILAINQRFFEVLGYDADDVYGKPMSIILGVPFNIAWLHAALSKEQKNCVWPVKTKYGATFHVRTTIGITRCPISGTQFIWTKLASMALENRNAQLSAEKERLEWDLATSQCHEYADKDPRELLGAIVCDKNAHHRTLGVMRDQVETDEAVSCANSFDHLNSSVGSPTLPGHALIASVPLCSEASLGEASIVSRKSSVMDTVSQAAAKDVTRAPPPPKARPSRPKKVCSEPLAHKPKAGKNPTKPKRALPLVEADPREHS